MIHAVSLIAARVSRMVRCFVRRSESPSWRVHELISPDGLIYTVRDAPGREREIQHPMRGTWTPESRTQFSRIPLYESYHAQQYRAAKPYTSNTSVCGPSPQRAQGTQDSLVGEVKSI